MSYLQQRLHEKINGKEELPKKVYRIPKKSAKKIAQEAAEKPVNTELDRWYSAMRKMMTGRCEICGGKTEKHNDNSFKKSIHHLFPKRKNQFPSVATHIFNRLELCFYDNSCHANLENGSITLESIKKENPQAWDIIIRRATLVRPSMTEEEKNRIPEAIMKDVENFFW